jgi:hypothetical protein
MGAPTNDKIRQATIEIDAYFDALLYEGMPQEEALEVERRRAVSHSQLTQLVMTTALGGWQRPGGW